MSLPSVLATQLALYMPLAHQIRGKAMADKAGDMMEVARDILLTARLDDRARFSQMVNETKAGLESGEAANKKM